MQGITLRPLAKSDAADLCEAINDAVTQAMTVGYPGNIGIPLAEKMIELRLNTEKNGTGMERAVLFDGVFAGTVSVQLTSRKENRGSLSYLITPSMRGRGIAGKACRIFLPVAAKALGLETVTAKVKKDNVSSVRTLLKLGFSECSDREKDGENRFFLIKMRQK